jgi:hypothetical protein
MISKFKDTLNSFIEYYETNINVNVQPFQWFNYGVIYSLLYMLLLNSTTPAWVLFLVLLIAIASFINAGVLYYIRNFYKKQK